MTQKLIYIKLQFKRIYEIYFEKIIVFGGIHDVQSSFNKHIRLLFRTAYLVFAIFSSLFAKFRFILI